jgi:hypothetical protein
MHIGSSAGSIMRHHRKMPKLDAHSCKNAVVKSSKNYFNFWQIALPTSTIRGEMKHAAQVDKKLFWIGRCANANFLTVPVFRSKKL